MYTHWGHMGAGKTEEGEGRAKSNFPQKQS